MNHPVKNESEPVKTGDWWEDHTGDKFIASVSEQQNQVYLEYETGEIEGPFTIEEFEDSRENLKYLGN